jgi:hypothetical protein
MNSSPVASVAPTQLVTSDPVASRSVHS